MSSKANPAKLNPLQLRTLTLLQALARLPQASAQQTGGRVAITQFPHAHGDHFHLGDATVADPRRHRPRKRSGVERADPQGHDPKPNGPTASR